jgi:hypothetical protein
MANIFFINKYAQNEKNFLPKDFNFDKMMPFLAQENEVRAGRLGRTLIGLGWCGGGGRWGGSVTV